METSNRIMVDFTVSDVKEGKVRSTMFDKNIF